ncbi:MAG: 2-(1,2-epoxy-1,2-dihydrophenyl)acetyl-CoA isomerase [Candidatus Azotimanducaceae bacterium]|jgi:2-(1,2-epoxy-1,2-dihydrophenyl)acetyl-CoA isomerase
MSDSDAVLYEAADSIATITLNRPSTLNAMNNALMQGISSAIKEVVKDASIRAVILTGAGRGFCSGADLTSIGSQNEPAEQESSRPANTDYFTAAMRALNECPVPTIAKINGAAAGGGFGLALACDITIACESAFFVATFGPKLGIVPDMGATWNIPKRVGRARALGITLLGDRITANEAADWGLIWKAVPNELLDQEIQATVEILKSAPPETVTRIRQTIDQAANNTFSQQLDLEMEHQAVLIPRNMAEGARAFMEKRPAQFGGRRQSDD